MMMIYIATPVPLPLN